MAVKRGRMYEKEYNCKATDLDETGFPPTVDSSGQPIEEGSKMYVWDDATKELKHTFKMVFDSWFKL